MKIKFYKLFFVVCLCSISNLVSAVRYWPGDPLTEWAIVLNNDLVYIESPQFPSHCTYARAQINVNESEYNKAMYASILSAKARNKKLKYVVDNAHTVCIIYGVREI